MEYPIYLINCQYFVINPAYTIYYLQIHYLQK
jgi:hypothetical protein